MATQIGTFPIKLNGLGISAKYYIEKPDWKVLFLLNRPTDETLNQMHCYWANQEMIQLECTLPETNKEINTPCVIRSMEIADNKSEWFEYLLPDDIEILVQKIYVP